MNVQELVDRFDDLVAALERIADTLGADKKPPNVQAAPRAGGVCRVHGVFEGLRCPECARTSTLAALRQAAWEATQWAPTDVIREYVAEVLREVESDEP